jgi:DMSO/TMAO reductase YedYZ molybdopterin-dependent catalytic subunit
MVKKTKGFNWGPAATACSEWTGVRMSTLLKYCGVRSAAQVRMFSHAQSKTEGLHSALAAQCTTPVTSPR